MESFTLEFCPRLKSMLDSGVAQLADGRNVAISATSTLSNLQVIRHFILTRRPTATLEIGLAFGASALTFLSSMSEVSAGEFTHSAVDPFQSTVWKGAALHAIREAGFADRFRHYQEESSTALPRFYAERRKFEMIYVDGSHLFEDVFVDFYFTARLLPLGGICLFDDCTDPHVSKVIKFIDSSYAAFLRRVPLSGIVQKPFFKRVANRLGRYQLAAFEKVAEPPRKWDAGFVRF
jgi:predicted O-methyltransferase YrrM